LGDTIFLGEESEDIVHPENIPDKIVVLGLGDVVAFGGCGGSVV
jgi:hypothetical protein